MKKDRSRESLFYGKPDPEESREVKRREVKTVGTFKKNKNKGSEDTREVKRVGK